MASFFVACLNILATYPEILIATLFFFLFRRSNRSQKNEPLADWPLFGMLPALVINLHNFHEWLTELFRQSNCTFIFKGPWFTDMNFVITCDPINIKHIFCTGFSNYPKGPEFSRNFDILGDGIFTADSDSWKAQRKLAHSLISSRRFRDFVSETSRRKVKGLTEVLKHVATEGAPVDLQDVFQRFTFDSTCLLVFGVDPGSLTAEFPTIPFAKAMDDSMEAIALRHTTPASWWMLLKKLNMGMEKKLFDGWKTIDQFINQLISVRREELAKSKVQSINQDCGDHGDFLTSYMESLVQDESNLLQFDDDFLRDTTINLMLAGRDTTAAALSWFFWLVSTNPDVHTKILEELKANSITSRDGSKETFNLSDVEKLNGLVYLHAALCETLRLFPPVPFNFKSVVKEEVLPSGQVAKKGMSILTSTYAIGRMESIWGRDCLEFKPERWISEKGRVRFEPPHKFMAFNAGPRICLGKEVAFTQMKMAVVALLSNFDFHLVQGHPVLPKLSIILHMKYGLMVRIKERS